MGFWAWEKLLYSGHDSDDPHSRIRTRLARRGCDLHGRCRRPAVRGSPSGFLHCAVTSGTFRYRAQQGTAMLAPGALLLGNSGTCYECGHEHGSGDRCLSFHFGPAYMERIVSGVPGARTLTFEAPRLPPLPALAPLLAEAETAREMADKDAFEEVSCV